jgi:hypothetical protein
MILSVLTFNLGREILSAGIVIAAVVGMLAVKRRSDMPVYDERDISLAEESTHQAVMWTGVFGGVTMIVISVGMGLNYWNYPQWVAPYYLTWGGILLFSLTIEGFKRIAGKK